MQKKARRITENGQTKKQPQKERRDPQRVLNEIEASKLSDIEFKIMVIRMLKNLSGNYRGLHGSYTELTVNYTSMKKYIETINKMQQEMKNTILELKHTLEGIKTRLDEAED